MKTVSSQFCLSFIAIAVTMLLVSLPFDAVKAQDGQFFSIKVNGASRWAVFCTLNTEDGVSQPSARGRGSQSTGAVVGRYVVDGTCTAEAAKRGPLELTLNDPLEAFDCPFEGGRRSGRCEAVVAAGDTMSFQVSLTP